MVHRHCGLQLLPTTCPNPLGPADSLFGCELLAGALAAAAIGVDAPTARGEDAVLADGLTCASEAPDPADVSDAM